MLQPSPSPMPEPLGGLPAEPAARSGPAPGDQQPTRFLLIRQKAGELPWLVRALMRYMAPVQVVSVIGMANALWRLGHERFDAVLLDVRVADRAVVDRCREQIADIAAVPVLNLHDGPSDASVGDQRQRPARKRDSGRAVPPVDHHEVARLPWERRAKRQARKAEQAASVT
jgi:hypothetical protein